MLGRVQEALKMLPALMCGTSIGRLQATDYMEVLEREWQSAGDHLKELFQVFLVLVSYQINPNQH